MSEPKLPSFDGLKYVPFEIIQFWKEKLGDKYELIVMDLGSDGISFRYIELNRVPGMFYWEHILGHYISDTLVVLHKGSKYTSEEFLKLLKLKAFW